MDVAGLSTASFFLSRVQGLCGYFLPHGPFNVTHGEQTQGPTRVPPPSTTRPTQRQGNRVGARVWPVAQCWPGGELR